MLIKKARQFYEATAVLRRNHVWGFAFGIGGVAIGALLRVALGSEFRGFPFITVYPPIIVTAFLCGWRAGAFAALVGCAVAWWYWIEPAGSFALRDYSAFLGLSFNILTLSIILFLTAGMHRGFHVYQEAAKERERIAEALEVQVAQRTQALAAANETLRAEVAQRREAEAIVDQLQRMDALGRLTGGIAHDFNNMLALIVGSVELARRALDRDPERARKQLDNALEGARRAGELTARLLAFSRQQPLSPRVLDPNKLISGMSELVRRTLGEQVEVETVLAGGVWRTLADDSQLESALLNLCINGRDAMPAGGKLTIETSNAQLDDLYVSHEPGVLAGQYVLVAVTDDGEGMKPDTVAKAFEPFFTTKGPGKGTGLGLSQVYGFVKQSGGHIKIYSELGLGTTVKIYLPRHMGEESASTGRTDRILALAATGECILVVEDEERVRAMSADALRELGYDVLEASNAAQALQIIDGKPSINLLFTDIVMPQMNGRELTERARQKRPDLKVLFTTGYTRNAVVHNGTLDPGVAFLPKPFTLDQLARKVRETLDA